MGLDELCPFYPHASCEWEVKTHHWIRIVCILSLFLQLLRTCSIALYKRNMVILWSSLTLETQCKNPLGFLLCLIFFFELYQYNLDIRKQYVVVLYQVTMFSQYGFSNLQHIDRISSCSLNWNYVSSELG